MDVEKPDEEYIWKGISEGLNKKRNQKKLLYWKIAASILIIISLGLLFQNTLWRSQIKNELILAGYSKEIVKQEKNLIKQINNYQQQLKKSEIDKKKLATDFSKIEEIDRLIKQYSDDLKNYGPDQRILNTLIDLYNKKIMVMDRMLNEIQKSKKNENKEINI
jgi:hypothetical protein